MRIAARSKLGFYPLPFREAGRIRRFLTFSNKQSCALDPCVGAGVAFAEITSGDNVFRQGVELDAGRAEQARKKDIDVIHGSCFDVHSPVESFSIIYLNPPYDFEMSEQKSQRMEKLFLEHVYRWLKPFGVLVLVVPAKRIADCAVVLSRHFRNVRIYRLTEPESVRYQQLSSGNVVAARSAIGCGTTRSFRRSFGSDLSNEKCKSFQRCRQNLTTSTLCRAPNPCAWSTADCPWTKSRICCRDRRRIVRLQP